MCAAVSSHSPQTRRNKISSLLAELKACSDSRNLTRGKGIHQAVTDSGDDSQVCIANALINMYGKCGSLEDALKVFHGMQTHTLVSWNTLITVCVENAEDGMALDFFWRVKRAGHSPDARTIVAALKACTVRERNVKSGHKVHLLASTGGWDSDPYVECTLLDMYAKCGSMDEARRVFDSIKKPDVVSWNALITGYTDNGQSETAVACLAAMEREGVAPDARSFVAALKACSNLSDEKLALEKAEAIHLQASSSGCDSDIYVESTLVDAYAKCASMSDARRVFEKMLHRNAVSWNALMLGYADNGEGYLALQLFSRMRREGCAPDERSFLAAIKACSDLETGKAVHLLASSSGCDSDAYVENTLVDMYAKCKCLEQVRAVFGRIRSADVVSWNALILGYAENGEGFIALVLFSSMRRHGCEPDTRTFIAALKACTTAKVSMLERGRAMHTLALSSGLVSGTCYQGTLIDMYAKCGSMEDARRTFDCIKHPDVICWNAMILGYADNGDGEKSLQLFYTMEVPPDSSTFVGALRACTELAKKQHAPGIKDKGRALHLLSCASGCDADIYVGSTLLDMYAKCRSMEDAQQAFDLMKHPDVVCWNALILGHADNGDGGRALDQFARMKHGDRVPNVYTFAAVLKACGGSGALEYGKAVQAEIYSRGLQNDAVLATCLLDFYAKCGNLAEAESVFHLLGTKDLVTWNALMAGYSRRGDTEAIFDLFARLRGAGLQPDAVTFSVLLTACSHAGLVDTGKYLFDAMPLTYGISPDLEHHTCMIDILGRSNKLDDAMVLLRSMAVNPDAVTWMAVLAACRKWKNTQLGRLAFETTMRLCDRNSGGYVLMANACWEEEQETLQNEVYRRLPVG